MTEDYGTPNFRRNEDLRMKIKQLELRDEVMMLRRREIQHHITNLKIELNRSLKEKILV